ncbi:MAG: DUF3828 domain-containing protein [Rhizomicrobium sp.]|jgi:hypothetical protein
MRTKLFAMAVVASMPFAAAFAASNAADVVSARAFVRALYDHYEPNGSFAVLADEEEPRYFARDTLSLLGENERLLKGEVGDIDVDPVCVCQDSDGMKATIRNVTMTGKDGARADVDIGWSSDRHITRVKMDLVHGSGGWRIRDISWDDGHDKRLASFRAALIKENRALAKAH